MGWNYLSISKLQRCNRYYRVILTCSNDIMSIESTFAPGCHEGTQTFTWWSEWFKWQMNAWLKESGSGNREEVGLNDLIPWDNLILFCSPPRTLKIDSIEQIHEHLLSNKFWTLYHTLIHRQFKCLTVLKSSKTIAKRVLAHCWLVMPYSDPCHWIMEM